MILGGGRYVATAGLFYRKTIFDDTLPFEKVIDFDYTNQIKGSLRGGIYYIDRCMAAYRKAVDGSWTKRIEQNKEQRNQHIQTEIAMLKQLDADTEEKYHEAIGQRIIAYTPFVDQLMWNKETLQKELEEMQETIYIWGMGLRGQAVQEFCQRMQIKIAGVCDRENSRVGERTNFQNEILDSEWVFEHAKVIVATNDAIAKALRERRFEGEIVEVQKYMRLS